MRRKVGAVLAVLAVIASTLALALPAPVGASEWHFDQANNMWRSHECTDIWADALEVKVWADQNGGRATKICINVSTAAQVKAQSGGEWNWSMCEAPLNTGLPIPEFCDDSAQLCECANDQITRVRVDKILDDEWRIQLRENFPPSGWSFTMNQSMVGVTFSFAGTSRNDSTSTIRFYIP